MGAEDGGACAQRQTENSPALQRWVHARQRRESRRGRQKSTPGFCRPCGTGHCIARFPPSTEVLGYCRTSHPDALFLGVAGLAGLWFTPRMSLETLKREIAALDDGARRELSSFLFSLREKQWAERLREMATVLDDPNPNRWLTLDEVRDRLEKIPEPAEE